MLQKLISFADNTHFQNAVKATISCVIPVVTLSHFGYFNEGFAMALGSILAFPSDVPGSISHKIKGILIAIILTTFTNLILGLVADTLILTYPVLIFLVFTFSMISVYGHRANMVSFVCLISVTLAFSHQYKGWELYKHCLLIFSGGLFYLMISLLFLFINPHRYIKLQIADCLKLTSDYLKLKGDLWSPETNQKKITTKQLELQVEINSIHENIREYLIRNTLNSSNSNENRKLLIIFINLVEILETSMSVAFNHSFMHEKFSEQPAAINTYQKLVYEIAATLRTIAEKIEENKPYSPNPTLIEKLENLESLTENIQTNNLSEDNSESILMLKNMQHYASKLIEKIKVIERVLTQRMTSEELKRKHRELEKFLTPQNYRLKTLTENLSFSSTTFRYSLRLSVTILIGFIVGHLIPFQNPYWILLTIVVIMRPGFGLTKKRSFERIFGTVLGGIIAFTILYFTDNNYLLGTLSVISMILGFTFSQTNYKLSATFVTLYVVFIYGMLTPNVTQVIQFRILDTLLGAGLCFISNYLFWPSWEFLNLDSYLTKSIRANAKYLEEISILYNQKGEPSTSYKLSRKQAFIEIGNLMASFQRMKQEPKSKQKKITEVYELVSLNYTLLSSSASLGTYVQSHKTTKASKAFNIVANTIIQNLKITAEILSGNTNSNLTQEEKDQFDISFTELKNIRTRELKSDALWNEDYQYRMEEAQLVIDHLIWLINMSESILKTAKSYKN